MSKVICSCCAETPKPIDWPARIRATGERAVRDCAVGKHWLGLNADLTPATSCAWGFCGFGK